VTNDLEILAKSLNKIIFENLLAGSLKLGSPMLEDPIGCSQ
jgi:hypothetical protein